MQTNAARSTPPPSNPTGGVGSSPRTSPAADSPHSHSFANDERETAFWLTVEQIALGLKHDVEMNHNTPQQQQQADHGSAAADGRNNTDGANHPLSSSTNSSNDSAPFSPSGGGNSSFTLTAHISSTLHQLIHLHYESTELEGRIHACRSGVTKHNADASDKARQLLSAMRMMKQVSIDSETQMSPAEVKLLEQITQLLQPEASGANKPTEQNPSSEPTNDTAQRSSSSNAPTNRDRTKSRTNSIADERANRTVAQPPTHAQRKSQSTIAHMDDAYDS